jgi:hypothetical protein
VSPLKIVPQWSKSTTTVDHTFEEAYSCFLENYSCFLEKNIRKLQKLITYSYGIQIIHNLVPWNPLENGDKTHKFVFPILIIVNSVRSSKSQLREKQLISIGNMRM